MSEQRFACTACGLCCYGVLPLTIEEALARAERFPLAMSIMPIKPGVRGHQSVAKTGASLQMTPKNKILLSISPVSFIPPSMPCPDLAPNNLCSVHETKPVRCRAMPFYAYKDEDHQSDMLKPRPGWKCATGPDAPVVYRDHKIVDRTDFDAERTELVSQAPSLQRYVDALMETNPGVKMMVHKAMQGPIAGRVVVGFITYLRYNPKLDMRDFARKQHPVMQDWLSRTEGNSQHQEYTTFYRTELNGLVRYLPKTEPA